MRGLYPNIRSSLVSTAAMPTRKEMYHRNRNPSVSGGGRSAKWHRSRLIHSSGTTGEDGGELVPTMSLGLGELAGEAIDVLGGPVVNIFRVGDRNFDGGLDRP